MGNIKAAKVHEIRRKRTKHRLRCEGIKRSNDLRRTDHVINSQNHS
jgi:hypothetical protein